MRTSEIAPFCTKFSVVRFLLSMNSKLGSLTKCSPTPSSTARFDCVAKPMKPGSTRMIEIGPIAMKFSLTETVRCHSKPGESTKWSPVEDHGLLVERREPELARRHADEVERPARDAPSLMLAKLCSSKLGSSIRC